jgi:hypothetical protein
VRRPKRLAGFAAAAGAVLLTLGACGGEDELTPQAEASVTPSPSKQVVQEFESARDLVDALGAEGLKCKEYRRLKVSQPSLADFGLCFLRGDRQFETDIYILKDESSRSGWVSQYEKYDSIYVLEGSNWFITNGSPEQLSEIAAIIGGQVVPK